MRTVSKKEIPETKGLAMTTEEQKECEYCHFNSRGSDFSDEDDCRFQLAKTPTGYYINAWSGLGGSRFDAESAYINYCPICGRKLKED